MEVPNRFAECEITVIFATKNGIQRENERYSRFLKVVGQSGIAGEIMGWIKKLPTAIQDFSKPIGDLLMYVN